MQENQIKLLLELKEKILALITQKQSQIAQFEQEIKDLQEQITKLDSIISTQSFTTAESLIDINTFLQTHQKKSFSTSNLTKKIFSSSNELLSVLRFENNGVFIRISNPEKVCLSQENYIAKFVKPTLLVLKQKENQMKQPVLTKIKTDSGEYIETIRIDEITNYESFELIENKIRELLGV